MLLLDLGMERTRQGTHSQTSERLMFSWLVTDSKDCVMSPDAFESDRPTDLEGDSHIKKTELLTEILKRTLRGTKIL